MRYGKTGRITEDRRQKAGHAQQADNWFRRDLSRQRHQHLLEEILDQAEKLPGRERMGIYLDLLPYQFPKRKPADQAPFVLAEFLEGLSIKQLEALNTEIYQRIESSITPEDHEKKYREVVQQIMLLKDLEDDPDSLDA